MLTHVEVGGDGDGELGVERATVEALDGDLLAGGDDDHVELEAVDGGDRWLDDGRPLLAGLVRLRHLGRF